MTFRTGAFRLTLGCLLAAACTRAADPPDLALARQLLSSPDDRARAEWLTAQGGRATHATVQAMNDLSDQTFTKRDYVSSLRMYAATCGVALEIRDQAGLAECRYGMGRDEWRLGHRDESMALYQEALDLFLGVGDHAGAAGALNGIGVQIFQTGNYPQALPYYQRALKEASLAQDEVAVARTNSNLGNVYKEMGDHQQAIACMQKALEITRKQHMDLQSAFILNNLGSVYYAQNETELALTYHEESLALKESQPNPDPADIASSVLNVGVALNEMGNYGRAIECFDRALALSAKANVPRLHALALYNYSETLLKQRKFAQATEKLKAVLKEEETVRDSSLAAGVRVDLAEMAVEEKRFAEGLALAQGALEIARERGQSRWVYRADEAAGAALHKLGRDAEAEAAQLDAIRVIEDLRSHLPGDRESAVRFMEDQNDAYIALAEVELSRRRPEAALAYVERFKARTLFDVLARGRADITKAMTEKEREQEAELGREVSRLTESLTGPGSQESRAALEKARKAYRAFEIALYAAHPQLKVQRAEFEPATPDELVNALPGSHTALLEYAVGEERVHLFVLTRAPSGHARLRVFDLPGGVKALRRDVERFRQQVASRDLDYRELAVSLYGALLAPAAEALRDQHTLAIVPDGFLWQLPFQALEPAPGRYLVEDHAVFYTPSLAVLREIRKLHDARQPAERRLLAVDAVGTPSARREVEGLRAVYGAAQSEVIAGVEADGERIKREAASYEVLHLAAHGVFEDRNPMNSRLLLARDGKPEGGVLEAREMMDLDLHAEMVVLSGCETGRGRSGGGEGLIGMSWALFIAGSHATVASQWKVESDATSELMLDFHRNLTGMPKAKALQQAALKVMRNPAYRHPFYWSGFVLMGEGW